MCAEFLCVRSFHLEQRVGLCLNWAYQKPKNPLLFPAEIRDKVPPPKSNQWEGERGRRGFVGWLGCGVRVVMS